MDAMELEFDYFRLHLRSGVTSIRPPPSWGRGRMLVHLEFQYPTSATLRCSFRYSPRSSMPTLPEIVRESDVAWMLLFATAGHEDEVYFDHEGASFAGLVLGICRYINASLAGVSAAAPPDASVEAFLQVFADIALVPVWMTDDSVNGGGGPPACRPAAAAAIESLEIVVFCGEEEAAADESNSGCVICLEDFEAGAELSVMPCGHRFDRHCLTRWLGESYFCPLCRSPLQRAD